MTNTNKRVYTRESDLLKTYKQALESAKYLKDIDDKLLCYGDVIRFCAKSDRCAEKQSVKRNQILFWTYNNIGDLFLQKDTHHFEEANYKNALDSYQNALEFSKSQTDQADVLTKIRDIYLSLDRKKEADETSLRLAQYVDDALKIEMFLNLANTSQTKSEESYFLEQALKYASSEKISFLKTCQNRLYICARLLQIYQKARLKADILRIENIKKQTLQNLN